MWTDSHCHSPSDEDLAAARAAGVVRTVVIGTDLPTSEAAVAMAEVKEDVWATVGLHPHDAKLGLDGLADLLGRDQVVAVGECGLDYHYDHSPREVQREVFAAQVAMARSHARTLVVHTREAWDDTFAVLRAEGVPERTVVHCFTGGPGEARRALDLGAYLSFSGIVTFKAADDVRAAAALCPADRLLVETDSPYLTPVPHRGRPNQPAFVPLVGGGVATARDVAVEEVEALTWANASAAFGLPA